MAGAAKAATVSVYLNSPVVYPPLLGSYVHCYMRCFSTMLLHTAAIISVPIPLRTLRYR